MKFIVICSEKDEAGRNIFRKIHEDFPSLNHYLIKEDSIHAENIDKIIEGDFFIFATKHQSQQHRKTLSIHAPGNFGKAELGGINGKLCRTSAFFLKHLFITLSQEAENSEYEVTLEATHHGPFIEKPCCFIEIGTAKEEWEDAKASIIIARTIKKAINNFNLNEQYQAAIGIASPHYCPNFNKIQLNSDIAVSHIIPQYALPLTQEMIKEAISKTEEKVNLAILDWKAMKSEDRKEAIKILGKLGVKYAKTSDARKI